MCGLVGLFSPFIAQSDIEKFEFLMLLSSTRGKDSSGVLSIIRDGAYNQKKELSYHYLKSPVDSLTYTRLREWKQMAGFKNTKGFMGHTRHATVGKVNSANAHPFESANGNVVGMHNGTLFGEYEGKDKYGTDSEALINILSNEGAKGLSKVRGAFAVAWFDCVNDTVNIVRNSERPLYYMVTKANDFVYASESWMLETFKNKFTVQGEVKLLPIYHLLSMNMRKEGFVGTVSVDKVEGLEAPKVTTGSSSFFRGAWAHGYYGAYDQLEHDWGDSEIQRWNPPESERMGAPKIERNLVQEARQAREEKGQAGTEGTKATGKVIGFSSVKKSEQPTTSTALAVVDSSKSPNAPQRFLKGLAELQRLSPEGNIEVQTFPGHWIPVDEFEDLIEYGSCKWTNAASMLSDKRIWLNSTEWVCEAAMEDPELQHIFGDDISKGNLIITN